MSLHFWPIYQYYQKTSWFIATSLTEIHLTMDPLLTSFLKISNFTSSLLNISLASLIRRGFLISGLSVPYLTLLHKWNSVEIFL